MSVFSVLLIGHLIGDFPLQTPTILRWKFRGGFWILPHIFIHGLVMTFLFMDPLIVAVVFFSHFLIDWAKVSLDDGRREGTSFLMDQSAHVIVLLVVTQFVHAGSPQLVFGNLSIILVLAVVSAVFMFLNVIKTQLCASPVPPVVGRYAFHVSKVTGWSAVIGLLLSILILR
jgi:hypothetical protein